MALNSSPGSAGGDVWDLKLEAGMLLGFSNFGENQPRRLGAR
jgi:hypothetical protein